MPKDEAKCARDELRQTQRITFLKRFTVFNVELRERLPEALTSVPELLPEVKAVLAAHALTRPISVVPILSGRSRKRLFARLSAYGVSRPGLSCPRSTSLDTTAECHSPL